MPRRSAFLQRRWPAARKSVVSGGVEISPPVLIGCRMRGDRLVALASRSHNNVETVSYLSEHGITDYEAVGSSLKFCLLAEGWPTFTRASAARWNGTRGG